MTQVLDGGQSHTVDSNSAGSHFHGSKHNIPGERSPHPAHQITQCIRQSSTTGHAKGGSSHPYSGTAIRNPSYSDSIPARARTAWGEALPGFLCCCRLTTG